jgi:hypothetical protein
MKTTSVKSPAVEVGDVRPMMESTAVKTVEVPSVGPTMKATMAAARSRW